MPNTDKASQPRNPPQSCAISERLVTLPDALVTPARGDEPVHGYRPGSHAPHRPGCPPSPRETCGRVPGWPRLRPAETPPTQKLKKHYAPSHAHSSSLPRPSRRRALRHRGDAHPSPTRSAPPLGSSRARGRAGALFERWRRSPPLCTARPLHGPPRPRAGEPVQRSPRGTQVARPSDC